MDEANPQPGVRAVLQLPEFRFLLAANAFATLASRALAVVIGYQIYERTHNTLALGFLGLVEAIPAVSLALFGGHVADRTDRRAIVLTTQAVSIVCALLFALISLNAKAAGLVALYAVIFIAGIARGFADPAASAFEMQVVPREHYVRASAVGSSLWQTCAIVGPAIGGFAYDLLGVTNTYLYIATLLVLSWICIFRIAPKPTPIPEPTESIWHSIAEGVRFVMHSQPLIGSMALDLFAVLFGGAIALMPVFAKDILHVGARGLGFLNAAPSVGALFVMLWSARNPPLRHAGRNLMLCVAGFGVCIIIFALSRNFYLSLLALAGTGAFDGVSVVVRKSIMRLMSPEHMRGRISSVMWIFIGSSNEIGAFESGFAAKLLGTVRSVWLGGLVTLGVVGATALVAPELRNLSLDMHQPLPDESEAVQEQAAGEFRPDVAREDNADIVGL